ncbi:MAG: hypothetical protein FWD53_08315 [Phycisphaerales bacterium]|nr:hypothetical protein [Phycisphaerales bacterium]
MTFKDMEQELDRDPFVPLRLHLASGKNIDIEYPNSAFLRQNTLIIMHRLHANTQSIGNYDVIALKLIERLETLATSNA